MININDPLHSWRRGKVARMECQYRISGIESNGKVIWFCHSILENILQAKKKYEQCGVSKIMIERRQIHYSNWDRYDLL